jgi:phosphoribosylamine--glycine ligase
MKVLLLGSGGREHALAWKISQSACVDTLFVLPGSDAISLLPKTQCVDGDAVAYAQNQKIDLVVIGPEKPMMEGVADRLREVGIPVLGPSRAAAQLETSKVFSKKFMVEESIPTAQAMACYSCAEALAVLEKWPVETQGVVIKADGLAAGKGVVVTSSRGTAQETIHDFMNNPACTVKAESVLIEKKLTGREVSAFALCDGEGFVTLGYACDYKRVNDGDQGPNTGGMGGYAPQGWPSQNARDFVEKHVFAKVVDGMKKRGTPFTGILFAGLMIDGDNVNVIEFNVRFGDPEAQILLPLFKGDIVPLFLSAAKGQLDAQALPCMDEKTAVHVVMTSQGYPDVMGDGMVLGQKISLPAASNANTLLFMAGARKEGEAWVNSGGRVLGVTAVGETIERARLNAYAEISRISFHGAHWRKDIGA